ncbi:hypothetical protein [Winogradskyella endarachnes]|uniref:Uncharacterized protein n=1 Tax=Winogradskyella endarachnes TaxID=2681965 RepID=A0A6L6UF50_9FLAO|nr:hypothetical protein [Winogradskyella endarachnes]MUU79572.1 hypothetical protein [Winogradskyella endarachnes]
MSYNTITYLIYLPIICFIMLKVGWLFYKNGEVFLLDIFQQNQPLVSSINKLLLIGYYLLNIGYAILTISYWEHLESTIEIINSLSLTLGRIIIILALMHYNNIFILKFINKQKLLNQ